MAIPSLNKRIIQNSSWIEQVLRFEMGLKPREQSGGQSRSLLDKRDGKMFNEMVLYVKLHNTSFVMACGLVVIYSVRMSIMFEH